jgi:endoglycosylceramidase
MAFDQQNKTIWNSFHQNREGVRDAFLDMVEVVSHRLSVRPNVVGYDILNEPWGSDEEIRSLVEDAASVIRERHPEAILFVPAHALVSGLTDNTMDKPNFSNFAYAPHYYDPYVMLLEEYQGTDVSRRLDTHRQKAEEWGTPMFLGEFGATPHTTDVTAYIDAIYDWLDARFISSAHWNYEPNWDPVDKDGWNTEDFSIVDDTGALRANFVPRPYPAKTAGVPRAFSLDENGISYRWTNAPAAGDAGTTEIFLPASYAEDKTLTVDSPSATGCAVKERILSCKIADPGNVTITLTRPPA